MDVARPWQSDSFTLARNAHQIDFIRRCIRVTNKLFMVEVGFPDHLAGLGCGTGGEKLAGKPFGFGHEQRAGIEVQNLALIEAG